MHRIQWDAPEWIAAISRSLSFLSVGVDERSRGMPLGDVVTGPASATLRALLHKAGVLGTVLRNIELELQGRILHLATTVTPLVDGARQRTGWVIVLDDLTEFLHAEKMACVSPKLV